MVLSGHFLKVLHDNGSEDASFANNGTLILGAGLRLGDLLIAQNGKIYVGGNRDVSNGSGVTQHALIKAYHPNGAPDLRFGSLGTAVLSMPNQTPVGFRRLLLPENGSLIALGSYNHPALWQVLITRYSFVR